MNNDNEKKPDDDLSYLSELITGNDDKRSHEQWQNDLQELEAKVAAKNAASSQSQNGQPNNPPNPASNDNEDVDAIKVLDEQDNNKNNLSSSSLPISISNNLNEITEKDDELKSVLDEKVQEQKPRKFKPKKWARNIVNYVNKQTKSLQKKSKLNKEKEGKKEDGKKADTSGVVDSSPSDSKKSSSLDIVLLEETVGSHSLRLKKKSIFSSSKKLAWIEEEPSVKTSRSFASLFGKDDEYVEGAKVQKNKIAWDDVDPDRFKASLTAGQSSLKKRTLPGRDKISQHFENVDFAALGVKWQSDNPLVAMRVGIRTLIDLPEILALKPQTIPKELQSAIDVFTQLRDCKINDRFTLEYVSEIEKLKREDAIRECDKWFEANSGAGEQQNDLDELIKIYRGEVKIPVDANVTEQTTGLAADQEGREIANDKSINTTTQLQQRVIDAINGHDAYDKHKKQALLAADSEVLRNILSSEEVLQFAKKAVLDGDRAKNYLKTKLAERLDPEKAHMIVLAAIDHAIPKAIKVMEKLKQLPDKRDRIAERTFLKEFNQELTELGKTVKLLSTLKPMSEMPDVEKGLQYEMNSINADHKTILVKPFGGNKKSAFCVPVANVDELSNQKSITIKGAGKNIQVSPASGKSSSESQSHKSGNSSNESKGKPLGQLMKKIFRS